VASHIGRAFGKGPERDFPNMKAQKLRDRRRERGVVNGSIGRFQKEGEKKGFVLLGNRFLLENLSWI